MKIQFSKGQIEYGIALSILGSAMLLRPSHFGSDYTAMGAGISLFAVITLFLLSGRLELDRRILTQVIIIITTWTYLLLHSIFLDNSNGFIWSAYIAVTTTTLTYSFLLSNRAIHDRFFDLFYYLIAVSCLSSVITAGLSFTFDIERIIICQLPTEAYQSSGYVAVPFTFLYGNPTEYFKIPRFLSFFREPGMAQIFIIWAVIYGAYYKKNKISTSIFFILVFGLIATRSTSTIISLAMVSVIFFSSRLSLKYAISTVVLSSLSLGLFYYLFYVAEYGVLTKIESASYLERSQSMSAGLDDFRQNPLGIGLYNANQSISNVNFIASIGQIGIPGIFLFIIFAINTIILSPLKIRKLIIFAPFIITWITAQPLINCPLLYIFSLQAMQTNRNNGVRVKHGANSKNFHDESDMRNRK